MNINFLRTILIIVLVELMAVSFCNVPFSQLEMEKENFCMRMVRDNSVITVDFTPIVNVLNLYKETSSEHREKIEMIVSLLKTDKISVQVQGLRAILSLPEDKIKPLVDESLDELKELLSISSESEIYTSKYFSSVIKTTGEFLKYVDERKPEIVDKLKRIFKSDNFSLKDRIAIIEAIGNLIIGYKKAGIDFENIDSEERDSLRVLMNCLIFGLEQNEEIKLRITALETLTELHKYSDVSNILEKTKSIKTIEKIVGKKLKRSSKSPRRLLGFLKKPGGKEKVSRLKLWSTAAKYLILTNKLGDSKQQITIIINQFVRIMEEITEKIEVDETVSFPILDAVTLEATKLSPYLLNESSGVWPPKNWDKFELLREKLLSFIENEVEAEVDRAKAKKWLPSSEHTKLYRQVKNWIECISQEDNSLETKNNSVRKNKGVILDKVWSYSYKQVLDSNKIRFYSLLGEMGYRRKEILSQLSEIKGYKYYINFSIREVAKAIADILLSEGKLDGTKSGLEYREVNETD